MPKVTMFFDPRRLKLTVHERKAIGMSIRPLVAHAVSTEKETLDPLISIDFICHQYDNGSLVHEPIAFEIETAGKPERIKKLTAEVVTILRNDIIEVLKELPEIDKDFNPRQLVWIKFIDPRGPHV